MPFDKISPKQFFEDVPQPSREAIEKALYYSDLFNHDLDSANLVGINTTYAGPYQQDGVKRPLYKIYTDGYPENQSGIYDVDGNILWN